MITHEELAAEKAEALQAQKEQQALNKLAAKRRWVEANKERERLRKQIYKKEHAAELAAKAKAKRSLETAERRAARAKYVVSNARLDSDMHVFQAFLQALGYKLMPYTIMGGSTNADVVSVHTLQPHAVLTAIANNFDTAATLVPDHARQFIDNELAVELKRKCKRYEFDMKRNILYFPHVLWNARSAYK